MATENDCSISRPSLTPREGVTTPRSKRKRARALLLVRSRSQHDVRARSNPSSPRGKKREEEWEEEKKEREREEGAELSSDPRAPGLLKIFGESVVAGVRYKTVLASTRSTAQELIKQALERYGLPARLHREFVLCEVAGRVGREGAPNDPSGHRQGDSSRRDSRRASRRRVGGKGATGGLAHLFSRSRSKSPGRDKRNRLQQQQQPPLSARPDNSDKTKHRNGILLDRARSSSPPNDHAHAPSSLFGKSKKANKQRGSKLVPCFPSNTSRCSLVLSQGHCDSPRTPLGSPRTPCGSPSTSRGSPRTSVCNVTSDTLDYNQGTPRSPRRSDESNKGGKGLHGLSPRNSDLARSQRFIHNGHKLQDRFGSVKDCALPHQLSVEKGVENRYEEIRDINDFEECQGQETQDSEWTEVSVRVLSNKDKPLLLQGFWKLPEGLFRRFELRRRRDLMMSLDGNDSNDDTCGLNDNARKIMISKVSPGVIPFLSPKAANFGDEEGVAVLPNRRTTLKEEWDKASMMTNATLTYGSPRNPSTINAVEGDTRQAYVCPSIYPYLLTLRGCSIQKDLVLYPLKSRSLSIGSSEKKANSDDIWLCAEDVLPVHCRVTLKRLPQGEREETVGAAEDERLYWYCLDLDIYASAYLTVNGVQIKQKASIYPGDLLGIGRQYLFLYKDPTGGHDIPSAVPWLPAERDVIDPLYARVCRDLKDNQATPPNLRQTDGDRVQLPRDSSTDYNDVDELNDSALRDAAIFLAYHRDKEVEVLEAIAEVNCSGKDEFPSSVAVLFLAAHHYSMRKFSGDHQTTFFKRLVRVIRAKVGFVSKSVSQQRYPSLIFGIPDKNQSDRSETDYFPCLISWLSNILTLLAHFRSSDFQDHVTSLARRSDVTAVLQECINCMEETVNFLFQQTVYTVTKALYNPINELVSGQREGGSSSEQIDQVLGMLKSTQTLADNLLLHQGVSKQLMAYLLFFLSTTLFNRVISKGSQLYHKDFGSALQADVSKLESWACAVGLTSEFNSFSEHLMSFADLLASSKRSLLRLDWEGFQRQFSPLTDAQLCKVLSEYNLGEGTPTPPAWYPRYAVDAKEDLTLSLSAHPQFHIPKGEQLVSLSETFPPAFFRRLEQVQHKFSLVGEDAYYSGLSSAGNTPRLSESMPNGQKAPSTFFLQDSITSSHQLRTLLSDASRKGRANTDTRIVEGSHGPATKCAAPIPPPKPTRSLSTEQRLEGSLHLSVEQVRNSQQQQQHHHQNIQSHLLQQQPEQHQPLHLSQTEVGSPCSHPPQQQFQNKDLASNAPYFKNNGAQDMIQNTNAEASNSNQPVCPPPYNTAMKNRRRPGDGVPVTQQQQIQPPHQSSMWSNHQNQPIKAHSHAAILKSGIDNNNSDSSTKASHAHGIHNIQPLPDFRDKASWRQPSHQHTEAVRHHGHLRPALKSQRSWANPQRADTDPKNPNLASSYPFMRPRPSSATEIENPVDSVQRDQLTRLRSNSALGNKSKHGHSLHAHPRQNQLTNQLSKSRVEQDYEHVKDSSNSSGRPMVSFNPNTVSTRQNLRKGDLSESYSSDMISTSEDPVIQRTNQSCPRLLRSSKIDLSDPNSTVDADVPPPLPPKGEYLLRRSSMGSQNSLESSGQLRPRVDSNHNNVSGSSSVSVRAGSGRAGGGSRASVEIQDVADHLIYNPNLPVQDMLDHNQNCFKMESKNVPSNLSRHKSSESLAKSNSVIESVPYQGSAPHIPPLELPDDLIAASDMDSPVDTFNKLSSRLPSDSTTSSFQSDRRQKFPGFSNLASPATGGSRSSLTMDASQSSISSDKYPDDIYIDVPEGDVDSSGSAASLLKVLPVEDKSKRSESDPGIVAVRYRHAMPESRDIATNGKVTGEVFSVSLNKAGSKLGMGLIDGLHTPLKQAGIYVRNVLPDTPAALCGAIRVGDRILSVNGKSIVGADYQSAMLLIRSTGPRLELLVAKCDRSVASKISASTT